MKTRISMVWLAAVSGLLLFQTGCLTPLDVRAVAEGQLISFVNALVNTVTGDAIRGAFGG